MKKHGILNIKVFTTLFRIIFMIFLTCYLNGALLAANQGNIDFKHILLPQNIEVEKIILTVEGKINQANPALFDLETIMKFPAISFTSYDPWTRKKQKYTGVLIRDLLSKIEVDPSAEKILVIAANKYKMPIKLESIKKYEYILAFKIDDTLLKGSKSIANKGNLVIAINFDKHKELEIEIYKSQLVWQVVRFIIE